MILIFIGDDFNSGQYLLLILSGRSCPQGKASDNSYRCRSDWRSPLFQPRGFDVLHPGQNVVTDCALQQRVILKHGHAVADVLPDAALVGGFQTAANGVNALRSL